MDRKNACEDARFGSMEIRTHVCDRIWSEIRFEIRFAQFDNPNPVLDMSHGSNKSRLQEQNRELSYNYTKLNNCMFMGDVYDW